MPTEVLANLLPRELYLRADLVPVLAAHRPPGGQERVFRFHQGGWLKTSLLRAKLAACGLPAPERPAKGQRRHVPKHRLAWVNFHTFRHTWASWMRRYGHTDVQGLVATGNWTIPAAPGGTLTPPRARSGRKSSSCRVSARSAAADPWRIRGVG